MAVNEKVLEAIVDTGSGHTLFKESAVKRVGGEINHRCNPPRLQCVTGAPLRILGMWKASIGIGDNKIFQRFFPIVPDNYLSCDLLLGCDVLGQAPLTWDGKTRALIWGDTPYTVNHIPRRKNKVSRVHTSPVELKNPVKEFKQINLKSPVFLDPYQTRFVPIPIQELPQTTLMVHPQSCFSHNSLPFLVNVTDENTIHVPLVNPTKAQKTFKKGTIVASYEEVDVPPPSEVRATRRIHNDLLPQNDQSVQKGTRVQRLRELIKTQKWERLTPTERTKLEALILENDPLFILSDQELGLISGPPDI